MSGMRVGVLIAACICGVPAAAQSDKSKPAKAEFQCLTAARDDFQAARLALLNAPPPRTLQSIVAERRAEEEYCLRVARCVAKTEPGPGVELQAPLDFSNCLEEVSLEKYDAKKRGE